MNLSKGRMTRRENLVFNVKVDEEHTKIHKQKIKEFLTGLSDTIPYIGDGDSINVDYNVVVEYFGNVASKLATLIYLREHGCKVDVNIAELEHGKCLLAEVIKHLDTLLTQKPVSGDHQESQPSED